ncbi:MAG TPA: hypothetical protein PK167_06220 [Prolixibacteraceae bacterium]|nr:hypothetical protein [Prolixibacteraceae bacterium]
MNKKMLLAALAAGVTAFFVGWLIFGIALMDFYEANTTHYDGLFKEEMNLWLILISNLLWGLLIAWIYGNFAGKKSMAGGALTGFLLGLLIMTSFDLYFLGGWNLFTPTLIVVDIIANAVWLACAGAVAGLILKTRKK